MSQTLMKLIKILAFLILVGILFLIPIAVAVFLGAPALTGFLISSAILSVCLLIWLFRAIRLRRREKKFIDGILEIKSQKASAPDRDAAKELSKRWKLAVKMLKKSNLKNYGNPLYVLPWYMLIGESGSGKTTAITNCGLSSKFEAPTKTSGVSGTKNCDWWFFEEAIIIDTAGRYAIHQDEAADSGEWRLFLTQLAKYRKKEPLNGLLVTISADKLLTFKPSEIEAEGKKIRVRIAEIMQALGAKIPIYILVTKCDLIHGMKEFCNLLPEKTHGQAFGYLNHGTYQDARHVAEKTFAALSSRLCDFRLRACPDKDDQNMAPEVLLFPEEFKMLQTGLAQFIDSAFNKSVYQEDPFLRGIYFTSAKQSGQPHSHFIEALELDIDCNSGNSETSYFLSDLFSKILPPDRKRFLLTQRSLQWKQKIRLARRAAWIAVSLLFCGLMSWSFSSNLSIIRQFQKVHSTPSILTGEFLSDVNTLEKLKDSILVIEKQNHKSWMPQFGLNHCRIIEREFKKKYCALFMDKFMGSYERSMTQSVLDYTQNTPGNILAKTIPHYVRRINLLHSSFKDNDIAGYLKTPQPDFNILFSPYTRETTPKALSMIQGQYLYYLSWAGEKLKTDELERLNSRLSFLITEKKVHLNWLVDWSNEQFEKDTAITLKEFWFMQKIPEAAPIIQPAYTTAGEQKTHEMIKELETAMDTPLHIEKDKLAFRKWYREQYFSQWYAFGQGFDLGRQSLVGETEKQAVIKRIGTGHGPYFQLLELMAQELNPWLDIDSEELPAWVEQVDQFALIKNYAQSLDQEKPGTGKSGILSKLGKTLGARTVNRLFGSTGRTVGRTVAQSESSSDNAPDKVFDRVARGYNQYVEGLTGISQTCISTRSSFEFAATVFEEDPATGDSAALAALRGKEDLKLFFQLRDAPDKMLMDLLDAPFDLLWGYSCNKAGFYIQKTWDEKVLASLEGVYGDQVKSDLLFGQSGYVNSFVSNDIAPFISRSSRHGYYAKKVAGQRIPFSRAFFSFLTKGAYSSQSVKSEYEVQISGRPSDVNPTRKVPPHKTQLELKCAQKSQTLTYLNYPVSKRFVWDPQACGDVTLNIFVGDVVLEKRYSGFRPFAQFLKDFSNGEHTFHPSDFPENERDLNRLEIEYIRVKYKIFGAGPIIQLLNRSRAGSAPRVIVKCST